MAAEKNLQEHKGRSGSKKQLFNSLVDVTEKMTSKTQLPTCLILNTNECQVTQWYAALTSTQMTRVQIMPLSGVHYVSGIISLRYGSFLDVLTCHNIKINHNHKT